MKIVFTNEVMQLILDIEKNMPKKPVLISNLIDDSVGRPIIFKFME